MHAPTTLKQLPREQPAPDASGLVYPHTQAPAPGELIAVAPGVYWLRMPLPFVLNHINLWLLEDGAGWTIVDCGMATDDARVAWEQIFARHLGGRPVTRVIVTHFHPDHIGLCHWLCEKFKLVPWITKGEFLQAHAALNRTAGTASGESGALMRRHGLSGPRMQWIDLRESLYPSGVPSLPLAHRRLRDGESVRIGPHAWRVVVGHGHAPEHASLVCEALGVFISGDMLLPRISTNVSVWPSEPDADPVGDFLASLTRYAAFGPQTLVLPSHGLPFRNLHARIAALTEHHQSRLASLRAACATPRCAVDALPLLFDRELDAGNLMFAMGEAIAHLNYLMRRGDLRRDVGADGVYTFQRMEK